MGCQREVGAVHVRPLLPGHLLRGSFLTALDRIAAAPVSSLFTHPSPPPAVSQEVMEATQPPGPLSSTFPLGLAHGSLWQETEGAGDGISLADGGPLRPHPLQLQLAPMLLTFQARSGLGRACQLAGPR